MNEVSILIIEDELEIKKLLKAVLADYKTLFADNAKDGIKLSAIHPPSIIILDLNLPDMDGIGVIENIRQWSNVPIIVLSARSTEDDKVTALEIGADDYLTKPFSSQELLARIKVALRHQQNITTNSPIFEYEDLKIDLEKRQVFVENKEVHLTPLEYKIVAILVKNAGKIVTYKQLLKEVWGKNYSESNHYLRIYIQHLRKKLKDDPLNPKYIITETAIGYRLKTSL